MSTATAHGSAVEATNGNGHVSFSELVRAHHEWDANGGHAAAEDVERRYRSVLSGFEAGAGEIVDAYWCRRVASGVALTRRERELRSLIRRRRKKLEYRLQRVSAWVTVCEAVQLISPSGAKEATGRAGVQSRSLTSGSVMFTSVSVTLPVLVALIE